MGFRKKRREGGEGEGIKKKGEEEKVGIRKEGERRENDIHLNFYFPSLSEGGFIFAFQGLSGPQSDRKTTLNLSHNHLAIATMNRKSSTFQAKTRFSPLLSLVLCRL